MVRPGFKVIPATDGTPHRMLIVDPEEGPKVAEAWSVINRGGSITDAARALNAAGVTTSRGGEWNRGNAGRLLRSAAYRGSLVDEDVFDRAQERLEVIGVKRVSKGRKRKNAYRYLFDGLLRCKACGGAVITTTLGKNNLAHYRCAAAGRSACTAKAVRAERIDQAATALIIETMRCSDLAVVLRRCSATTAGDVEGLRAQAAELEEQQENANMKRRRIGQAVADGLLAGDEISEAMGKVRATLRSIDAQLGHINERLAVQLDEGQVEGLVLQFRAAADALETAGIEDQRAILQSIVAKVVFDHESLAAYLGMPQSSIPTGKGGDAAHKAKRRVPNAI